MTAIPRQLDVTFQALANATRRAVVERLQHGPVTVSELARQFKMTLPSFLQHLQVLETSGLVQSWKKGRVRTVQVVPKRLQQATNWLEQQRVIWEKRLDQLDSYVNTMENDS